MKQKRLLILILLFITTYTFSQNEVSIELTNASYKSKETKLTIGISIKNNTDSSVYIVTPKKYFFYKHLDTKNSLKKSGLNRFPYSLEISSNKKCKTNDDGYESVMFGREVITFNILKDIDEIKPNEIKTYENIEINRFDGEFCSNRKYNISITYNPKIHFDKNFISKIKTKYDLILKETKELNSDLNSSLNNYKSIQKDNFEKLNSLFSIIPKIESFNDKNIKSNSITASEIK
ncbi:hypothetical protein SAMN05444411_1581 [Lutibacter oricola]|uniref:DUF4369 domain-containing protein n=1 Tax=Lutibacter oricola TaxID=762486 RepID=A0A1H3HUD5_9FLAO|nr:hypothetical protein [Lutibacter oricola]SDY18309.1 hypothetical protein SAMN05444411_1581 [Lutibacter oricola]